MINLKQTLCDNYFNFTNFSGTAEVFIGYSILQLSLYTVSLPYFNVKSSSGNSYVAKPNFSFIGAFIFLSALFLILNEDGPQFHSLITSSKLMLLNDYLAFLSKAVICLVVFVFFLTLSFTNSCLSLSNSFEYFSFVATSALGSLVLCSAGDLITAYLAIELQSVSFYLMACSKKNSSYSIESGLKYFIVGSFSSAFFLLGSSYIYVSFGTLNLAELKVLSSLWFYSSANGYPIESGLISVGFILICSSLLIKLAVAPFHLWSIDVYESSPNPTTYFFAVVPKLGLFVLLIRIFYSSCFCFFLSNFAQYCMVFSLLSMFVGALGGVEQRKLKSLLAYSSVGHTGYVLLAFSTGVELSIVLMVYYLILYMVSSLCFWSIFMFLKQKTDSYKTKTNKELGDLTLLVKANPILAFILGGTLFSLAGTPPLLGFLIKFGAFLTLIQSSAYTVAVFAILLTVISTFYYLRLIKILFFENGVVGKLYHPVNSDRAILLSLLAWLLLVLFIKPTVVYLSVLKSYLLIF